MPVPHRLSLWAASVETSHGRSTIRGEVWLGPVVVGDWFTSVATGTHSEPVRLRLDELTAPPDAQEVGRVERVLAVVTGDGIERLRPGVVLLGESQRKWVLQ